MGNSKPISGNSQTDKVVALQQPTRTITADNLNKIPKTLRGMECWCRWSYGQSKVDKKTGKVKRAKIAVGGHDWQGTWHNETVSFFKAWKFVGRCDGIGITLNPEMGLVGGDIDDCFNEDKTLKAAAQEIIDTLPPTTYIERSPSGNGIRFFLLGAKPSGFYDKVGIGEGMMFELYDSKRFLTVTGRQLNKHRNDIPDSQATIDKLCADWLERPVRDPIDVSTLPDWERSNEQVLEKMFAGKNGAKYRTLFEVEDGWMSFKEYESQSDADFALVNALARYAGNNPDQIDELFRESKLCRPEKWDRLSTSTINKALQNAAVRWAQRAAAKDDFATVQGKKQKRAYKADEISNAWRFVDHFGDDFIYVDQLRSWFYWDGLRYVADTNGHTVECAKSVMTGLYKWAEQATSSKARRRRLNFVIRSCSSYGIRAALSLAQSDKTVAVPANVLDGDQNLINFANGTYDLSSGHLREHRKSDRLTKVVDVGYDPAAKCPRWKKFLREIFAGNDELIDFIQRSVGYSLAGHNREQVLIIEWGEGSNGKGVFTKTIQKALGFDKVNEGNGYAVEVSSAVLTGDSAANRDGSVLKLKGALFASCSETAQGEKLNEERAKRLTGNDPIPARTLFKETVTFMPTHVLWMQTNHKPRIEGVDYAIWRRIILIPFVRTFKPEEEIQDPETESVLDRNLESDLERELPGIVAWIVEGYHKWQSEGLLDRLPATVKEAIAEYRSENDVIQQFIAESCVRESDASVGIEDLHQAFGRWSAQNGIFEPMRKDAFGKRLTILGFRSGKDKGGKVRTRKGLRLRSDFDD